MNATDQRQRHTALAEVEEHLHDVMTVIEAMAGQIVKDREVVDERFLDVRALLDTYSEQLVMMQEDQRRFTSMSFWQRLRWLVGL